MTSAGFEDPDYEDYLKTGAVPSERASTSLRSPNFQKPKPAEPVSAPAPSPEPVKVGSLPPVREPRILHQRASSPREEARIQQTDQATAERAQREGERARGQALRAVDKSGPYQDADGKWKVRRADDGGDIFEVEASQLAKTDRQTGDQYFEDDLGQRTVVGRDETIAERSRLLAERSALRLDQQAEEAAINDVRVLMEPVREEVKQFGKTPDMLGMAVKQLKSGVNPQTPDPAVTARIASLEKQLADWHKANPGYAPARAKLDEFESDLQQRESRKQERKWEILGTMTDPGAAERLALRPRGVGVNDEDSPLVSAGGDVDLKRVDAFAQRASAESMKGEEAMTPTVATLAALMALKQRGAKSVSGKPIDEQIAALTPRKPVEFAVLKESAEFKSAPDKALAVKQWVDDMARYGRATEPKFDEATWRGRFVDRGWLGEIGAALYTGVADMIPGAVGHIARAMAGGVSLRGGAWYDELIEKEENEAAARPQSFKVLAGDEIHRQIAQGVPSMPLSLVTQALGYVGALGAKKLRLPVPEKAAAFVTTGAAFGLLAKDQFEAEARDWFLERNPKATEEQWQAFQQARGIDGKAWAVGAVEGLSEGIGAAIDFGIARIGVRGVPDTLLKKWGTNALAKAGLKLAPIVGALGMSYAQEAIEETVSGVAGQKAKERAGIADGPKGIREIFHEQGLPGGMAGLLQGGAMMGVQALLQRGERDATSGGTAGPDAAERARAAAVQLGAELDDAMARGRTARDSGDAASAAKVDEEVIALSRDLNHAASIVRNQVPTGVRAAIAKSVDTGADVQADEQRIQENATLAFASAGIGAEVLGTEAGAQDVAVLQFVEKSGADADVANFIAAQHAGLGAIRDLGTLVEGKAIDGQRAAVLEGLGLVEADGLDGLGNAPTYRITDDALPLLPPALREKVKAQPELVAITPGDTADLLANLVKAGRQRFTSAVQASRGRAGEGTPRGGSRGTSNVQRPTSNVEGAAGGERDETKGASSSRYGTGGGASTRRFKISATTKVSSTGETSEAKFEIEADSEEDAGRQVRAKARQSGREVLTLRVEPVTGRVAGDETNPSTSAGRDATASGRGLSDGGAGAERGGGEVRGSTARSPLAEVRAVLERAGIGIDESSDSTIVSVEPDGGLTLKWHAAEFAGNAAKERGAVEHELWHIGGLLADRKRWEAAGSPGSFVTWYQMEGLRRLKDLGERWEALPEGGEKAAIGDALVGAFNLYVEDYARETPKVQTVVDLLRALEADDGGLTAPAFSFELVRMIGEMQRRGRVHEQTFYDFVRNVKAWLEEAVLALRELLALGQRRGSAVRESEIWKFVAESEAELQRLFENDTNRTNPEVGGGPRREEESEGGTEGAGAAAAPERVERSAVQREGGGDSARRGPEQAEPVQRFNVTSLDLDGETIATGGAWASKVPRGSEVVRGKWALVPLRLLGINKGFGADQDRIDREASGASQRAEIVANMTPDNIPLAWGNSATLNDGSPIITPDGSVVVGNNRTMALRDMYRGRGNDVKAGAYRRWAVEEAERLGLPAVEGKEPVVLVRVVEDAAGLARGDLVKAANVAGVQAKSDAELALADTEALDNDALMAALNPNEDGSLNRDFLGQFYRTIGAPETLRAADGGLDPAKVSARAQRAMLARLLKGTPGFDRVLSQLVDASGQEGMKRTLAGVFKALPGLIKIQRTNEDLGILRELGRALGALPDYRAKLSAGTVANVEDYLAQGDLLEAPLEGRLLRLLANGGADLAGQLTAYVRAVEAYGDPAQDRMFPEPAPDRNTLAGTLKTRRDAAAKLRGVLGMRSRDARIVAKFGEDWAPGFNAMGLPNPPETLPAGHPLLVPTARERDDGSIEYTRATAKLLADHPLVVAGLIPAGVEVPRRRFHAAVIAYFRRGKTPLPTGQQPRVIATAGGGGAGKSTVLRTLGLDLDHLPADTVLINSDEIKVLIPEFGELAAAGDGRGAAVVHEESSQLAKLLLRQLTGPDRAADYNVVYDATMSHRTSAMKLLRGWKDAGFFVQVVGVTIDPMEAMIRASLRAKRSWRWVNVNALITAHAGFNGLAREELMAEADAAALFDNTQAEPKKLAEKSENRVEVVDADGYSLLGERSKVSPKILEAGEGAGSVRAGEAGSARGGTEGGGRGGREGERQGEAPGELGTRREDTGTGDLFASGSGSSTVQIVPPAGPKAPVRTPEWRAELQSEFSRQKARLTKAENAKDWQRVLLEVAEFNRYWEAVGTFPDDWARWERAKSDAELKLRMGAYVKTLPAAAIATKAAVKKAAERDGLGAVADDLFAFAANQPAKPVAAPGPAPAPATESVSIGSSSVDERKADAAAKLAFQVEEKLRDGEVLSWQELFRIADQLYGGTQANHAYTPKDAYDAVELGVNRWIMRRSNKTKFDPVPMVGAAALDRDRAVTAVRALKEAIALLPTQSKRTEESDEFQQFSTVPPLAYMANYAAAPNPKDVVLEPSAGIGGLAVFAKNAGAEVVLNELSPRRAAILRKLGIGRVFTENAEQIDNVLPPEIVPTLVVMNPPFSATAGRMQGKRDTSNATRHLEQALTRLAPGGRLVAIVGEGMALDRPAFRGWWAKMRQRYDVRAGVIVNGEEYAKYGTTFDNMLVVIDKPVSGTGSNVEPITGRVEKVEELVEVLAPVRYSRPNPQLRAPDESRPSIPGVSQPMGSGVRQSGGSIGSGSAGAGDELRPASGTTSSGGPSGARTDSGGVAGGSEASAGSGASGGSGVDVAAGRPEGERAGSDRTAGDAAGGVAPELLSPAEWLAVNPWSGLSGEATPKANPVVFAAHAVAVADAFALGKRVAVAAVDPAYGIEVPANYRREGDVYVPQQFERAEARHEDELTDSVFENYQPRIKVPEATMPPVELQESAAMASVEPPTPTYRHALPETITKPFNGAQESALSAVALETVILAGNAHGEQIPMALTDTERDQWRQKYKGEPPEEVRRGFFNGDGTGVGKGRQWAGIILDNVLQGRRKHVVVTEKPPLVNDARRDLRDVGQLDSWLFEVSKVPVKEKIEKGRGIAFITYATLRSEEKEPAAGQLPKTRVDQLVEWLGADFDGVLVFDEAHNMANNTPVKGKRGMTDPSHQALAGLELQRRLPQARVVYFSATGATEVENLGYAERLGLWGPGTQFSGKMDFIHSIASGGVAAMELVARDMKAMGMYLSRSLSWRGVTYDRISHKLSEEQRFIYDKLAEAWQLVLARIDDALEATGATSTDPMTGQTENLNSQANMAAKSAFWGAHQRFFNQIITSMKLPTVIGRIEQSLKDGNSVVLQLVNTNEAALTRALAQRKTAAAEAGEEMVDIDDLDLTPRDNLMQFVLRSFPIIQQEQWTDTDGNTHARPALDSEKNPIVSREAVAMRDALLDELASIRVPAAPIDMLLEHFGVDNVAEVTGRTKRVVERKDPRSGERKKVEEKRTKAHGIKDADEFQEGKRRILVFSNAGGTGRSYHADLKAKNQQRRDHIILQPGWQAAQAVQGTGRSHRNNQRVPPNFGLAETDIPGEKRFISSIARRLDQLGAVTKGQRQAASQGLFKASDNLESQQAQDALRWLYRDVLSGNVAGVTGEDFEKQMGLKLRDNTGAMRDQLPPITQFLNRMLSLKLDLQEKVAAAFFERVETMVEQAIASGNLDTGLENIRAKRTKIVREQVLHRDPRTGAETRYAELELTHDAERVPWEDVARLPMVKNLRSGKVWAKIRTEDRTDSGTGNVVRQWILEGVSGRQKVPEGALDNPQQWVDVPTREAEALWAEQIGKAPKERTETVQFITGALLPVWKLLGSTSPQVRRVQLEDGRRIIGRVVGQGELDTVLTNLGVSLEGEAKTTSAEEAISAILDDAGAVRLGNGWKLKAARVSSETRIELTGPGLPHHGELDAAGVFRERINFQMRYFVPREGAVAVLQKLVDAGRPIAEVTRPRGKLAMREEVADIGGRGIGEDDRETTSRTDTRADETPAGAGENDGSAAGLGTDGGGISFVEGGIAANAGAGGRGRGSGGKLDRERTLAFVRDEIAAARDRHPRVPFRAGRSIDASGSMYFDPRTGHVVYDSVWLAAEVEARNERRAGSGEEWLRLAIDEEVTHRRDADATKSAGMTYGAFQQRVWAVAPAGVKAAKLAVYPQTLTEDGRPDDRLNGAELIRMLDQWTRLGTITEAARNPERARRVYQAFETWEVPEAVVKHLDRMGVAPTSGSGTSDAGPVPALRSVDPIEESAHQDAGKTPLELVRDHLGLATSIAQKFDNIRAPKADVIQAARAALVRTARLYKPELGPFAPYAGQAIRNELSSMFRREGNYAHRNATTLDERLARADSGSSLTLEFGEETAKDQVTANIGAERPSTSGSLRLELNETAREMNAAIDALAERPREILRRMSAGESGAEIARAFGVTQQAVNRMADFARKAVAKTLKGKGFNGVDADGVLYARAEGPLRLIRNNLKEYSRSSTQVTFPTAEAVRVREFAASIPEAELFIDPNDATYGREGDPHVTVLYGITSARPQTAAEILQNEPGPVKLSVGPLSLFQSEKYDVLKADIESADLHRLNGALRAGTNFENDFPDYHPHMTVAYLKPGEGAKYVGQRPFDGMTLEFDEVEFRGKDGKIWGVTLGKVGGSLGMRKLSRAEAEAAGFTVRAFRGVSRSRPFNDTPTVWLSSNAEVAESYAREVFGYDDPAVIEVRVNGDGIARHDIRKISGEELARLAPDAFGNPQAVGIYHNSDDSMLGSGVSHTALHVPRESVVVVDDGGALGTRPETIPLPGFAPKPAAEVGPGAKTGETEWDKLTRPRQSGEVFDTEQRAGWVPTWFSYAIDGDPWEMIDVSERKRWHRLPAVLFESAADVLERQKNPVAQKLAQALHQATNLLMEIEARLGTPLDAALARIGTKAARQTAKREFAEYQLIKSRDGKLAAENALLGMSAGAQELVLATKRLFAATGSFAQRQGVMVWDQRENDGAGGYRRIGNIGGDYWPRSVKADLLRAIEEPDKYPEVIRDYTDRLRAENWTEAEIANFFRVDAPGLLQRNDFFGQLEMARVASLPASFYEYDFDAVVPGFIRGYSERMAQIIAYGQKLKRDPDSRDLFDEAMEESRNAQTVEFVQALQKQVYRIGERNAWNRFAASARTLASGLLLANPFGTVPRNVISGVLANIEMGGTMRTLKALAAMMRGVVTQMTARQLGTVKANVLDAIDYSDPELTAAEGVRKFAQFTLTASGYHGSERFVRTLATATAMQWVTDYLGARADSNTAREAEAFMRRVNVDPATVRVEAGDFQQGRATRTLVRRFVLESQFGYDASQVPLWANSPTGRLFYQYGRWGTQRARTLWKHVFEPALFGEELNGVDGKRYRARRMKPLATMLAAGTARLITVGGGAVLTGELFALVASMLFKRDRDDEDWHAIIAEAEKDPGAAAKDAAERLTNDIMLGGMLGILSQPVDLMRSWVQGSRFKNPIEPPASAVPRASYELLRSWGERGLPLSWDDARAGMGADLWTAMRTLMPGTGTVSDTVGRMGALVTDGVTWFDTAEAERTVANIRKASRRFAKEYGLEPGARIEGRFGKTDRSATYDRLQDALLLGDVDKARKVVSEYEAHFASGADPGANRKAMDSLKASVRGRQPVKVGSHTSEEVQTAFIEWARTHLTADRVREIERVQLSYEATAQALGLMK